MERLLRSAMRSRWPVLRSTDSRCCVSARLRSSAICSARRAQRRPPRAVGFEHGAQVEDLVGVGLRPDGDDRAEVRRELDESFRVEPAQRLAHRRAADADGGRDLLLGQARAREVAAGDDAGPHRVVGPVDCAHRASPVDLHCTRQPRAAAPALARRARAWNCGAAGGSRPVSALQRDFSSAMSRKPRSNSGAAPRFGRHLGAQRRRRRRVDAPVLQHDAVAARAFLADQAGLDVERDLRRLALERIAAAAAAPGLVDEQVARLDLDAIGLRRQQLLAAVGALQQLAAARAGQSAVHAPGIGEPAIVVDRDLARLEEPVADADAVAAAEFPGPAASPRSSRRCRCAAESSSRGIRSARS